jgi:hypothetical protein
VLHDTIFFQSALRCGPFIKHSAQRLVHQETSSSGPLTAISRYLHPTPHHPLHPIVAIVASMEDPSKELPRDPTGSYLHLKLKRYPSIDDLSMKFAISTWKRCPQDAQVDMSPTSRSSCRQCHEQIEKDDIRMRLFLQCHKGCKNSAYFHQECFWKYPETTKLEKIEEIADLENLPEESQAIVRDKFQEFRKQEETALKHNSDNKKEENEAEGDATNETTHAGQAATEKPRKRRKTK